jgi:hypothetical protein
MSTAVCPEDRLQSVQYCSSAKIDTEDAQLGILDGSRRGTWAVIAPNEAEDDEGHHEVELGAE